MLAQQGIHSLIMMPEAYKVMGITRKKLRIGGSHTKSWRSSLIISRSS
jgi:hypothetical protein